MRVALCNWEDRAGPGKGWELALGRGLLCIQERDWSSDVIQNHVARNGSVSGSGDNGRWIKSEECLLERTEPDESSTRGGPPGRGCAAGPLCRGVYEAKCEDE